MARRRVQDEEDWDGGEEDLDPDAPDPSDMDDDDEPDLLPCPHCRRMVDEDTEKCPHCGEWIEVREQPASPMFWVVIVVLLLLVFAGMAGWMMR